MCKDTCNKCNECNPCDRKCNQQDCGCKFEVDAMCVRYTKNDLECSGLPKGTILEDIIEAFDRKLCETGDVNQVVVAGGDNVTVDTTVVGDTTTYTINAEAGGNQCNNLYLSLNPTESETYVKTPEIVLTGGTAPYTYKWSLQQTGGTSLTIGNTTTNNFSTMLASMQYTYGNCHNQIMNSGAPCRVSNANGGFTDPTHAWHFKLEVTDANGCKVKDYWTHYQVFTF